MRPTLVSLSPIRAKRVFLELRAECNLLWKRILVCSDTSAVHITEMDGTPSVVAGDVCAHLDFTNPATSSKRCPRNAKLEKV